MKALNSLVLVAFCVGLFGACASHKPLPRTGNETVAEQLEKVRKGMSSDEVKTLLGEPDRIELTNTPKGKGEQWIYSETTLVRNINGTDAAAGHTYMQKLGRGTDRVVLIRFENGLLVSEGF
jgi:outer membrane protein assembly factor BamE (lipoprotein component of BamABCDE complex)